MESAGDEAEDPLRALFLDFAQPEAVVLQRGEERGLPRLVRVEVGLVPRLAKQRPRPMALLARNDPRTIWWMNRLFLKRLIL